MKKEDLEYINGLEKIIETIKDELKFYKRNATYIFKLGILLGILLGMTILILINMVF